MLSRGALRPASAAAARTTPADVVGAGDVDDAAERRLLAAAVRGVHREDRGETGALLALQLDLDGDRPAGDAHAEVGTVADRRVAAAVLVADLVAARTRLG